MTIGERLKKARKDAKLTQVELAKRVNLKQSTLSDLELGKSTGSTSIAALANTLGVTALWLEMGRGPQKPSFQVVEMGQREARMVLAFDDEETLLDLYRRADPRGRRAILRLAQREGGATVADEGEA